MPHLEAVVAGQSWPQSGSKEINDVPWLASSFCSFLCNLEFQYIGEYHPHSEWAFLLQLILSLVKYFHE